MTMQEHHREETMRPLAVRGYQRWLAKVIIGTVLGAGAIFAVGTYAFAGNAAPLLGSINQRLAGIAFSSSDAAGLYTTEWSNSYQFELEGRVLTIAFNEDHTTYDRQGTRRDRYAESGVYTIDLRRTDATLVTVEGGLERLQITCRDSTACIGQDYDGILYDNGGRAKADRKGSKWLNAVGLYLPQSLLAGDLPGLVRQLIDGPVNQ